MTVRAVDLFCGAGGLSTGLALACEQLNRDVELAAVNHWRTAVETHKQNHPWADHYCTGIGDVKPIEVFPESDIDLLIAAPECTDYSKARGGKPITPQDRMAPFAIFDWIAQLRPRRVLVENVNGFQNFGPIVDGEPTRNGQFFQAWLRTLGAKDAGLGYHVDKRTLTAANFGDPTTRERLFIVAGRDETPVWPSPTHSDDPTDGLEDWRPAAGVIDWSDRGQSIWTRGLRGNGKKPLVKTTMGRIAEGIERYGPDEFAPLAAAISDLGRKEVRTLQEDSIPIQAAPDAVRKRSDPFLVRAPVPEDRDLDRDYDDIVGLCPPVVKGQHGGSVPRDAGGAPVQTVTCDGNLQVYEYEAFVLPRLQLMRGDDSTPAYHPAERPFHTVTAKNHDGHLVTPYLTVYNGQSSVADIDDPLPTVTGSDRFGLVVPELYPWGLDVRYRMLQPRELARAQGFADDYEFAGDTKDEITEQIGNAVPVGLATALCRELLEDGRPQLTDFASEDGDQTVAADGGESV